MPGRSGSPTPASSGKRASSPLTSVPSGCRRRGGRRARPACRRRSRRRRRGRPRTRPPASAAGRRGPRDRRRVDLDDLAPRRGAPCPTSPTSPSTRTPPAAIDGRRRRPADVGEQRDDPVEPLAGERRRDRARRSSIGDVDPIVGVGGRRSPAPVGAGGPQAAEQQQHAADRDADVGDVEDRPPLHVDEVDDAAAQPARRRGTGGREVADRAADDQPDGDRVRAGSSTRPTSTSRPTTTTRATTPMTGPSPVPCENAMPLLNARLNRSVQTTSIVAVGERVDRPLLGELVDAPRRRRRSSERRRAASGPWRAHASIALIGGRSRRPSPRRARSPTGSPRGARAGSAGRTRPSSRRCRRPSARARRRCRRSVWRACADSARSRSRSTTIVSPSPLSSSNCTSPISPSSISEFASSSSRLGLAEEGVALGDQQRRAGLQELDVEVLGVGDAVLGGAPRRRDAVAVAALVGGARRRPAAWRAVFFGVGRLAAPAPSPARSPCVAVRLLGGGVPSWLRPSSPARLGASSPASSSRPCRPRPPRAVIDRRTLSSAPRRAAERHRVRRSSRDRADGHGGRVGTVDDGDRGVSSPESSVDDVDGERLAGDQLLVRARRRRSTPASAVDASARCGR